MPALYAVIINKNESKYYNKQCAIFKVEIFKQQKIKDSVNCVSLNIKKLSPNTIKYLNVQCTCNENCSSLCPPLSSFPSPLQQGYGESNTIGNLYLLLPIFTSVFHLIAISFVFHHVHVNNSPQLHKAIHTEISITHKTDYRGMRSFTWEWTDLQMFLNSQMFQA